MLATRQPDPYPALMDPDDIVPDGAERYFILGDIPIERLQALPYDYGRTWMCGYVVSRGS
ncbi:hypothetical protein ABZS66_41835 [Dactylosporangium sp. NPDC005572]|uniref:hypothetical protein n=1 Tax=Dactylosporangium sp. NPDC005572 TaxID=3156889 RepID=UPI0033ACB86D